MQASGTITLEKIDAAIKRIVSVAPPRKVMLFGSIVAGKPDIYSDVDILVVTGDEVESNRRERVHIRRALRGMTMPLDVLVISEKRLQEVADQSSLVYREVLRYGRVVDDAVNDR